LASDTGNCHLHHPAALAPQKYSTVLNQKRAGCSAVRTLLDGILSLFKKERETEKRKQKRKQKEREKHELKTYFCTGNKTSASA
jgi:hypothetical protein